VKSERWEIEEFLSWEGGKDYQFIESSAFNDVQEVKDYLISMFHDELKRYLHISIDQDMVAVYVDYCDCDDPIETCSKHLCTAYSRGYRATKLL